MSDTISETAGGAGPAGTAPAGPGPEAEEARGPSLSPSRAADFMTCPLLYRFRVIDKLPEPPSQAAARGTLVHAVLERLFDQPAAGRTPQVARDLVPGQWERLLAEAPELGTMFADDAERAAWFDGAGEMLDRYFTLEDPTRLEPHEREMSVHAMLASGLALRGYIDRLDVAPTGEVRIVDYKTGTAPREEYEARALFQMKFYAVALWRAGGTVPRMLQLIYLGNGEIVRYMPDEADLVATERKINALWLAIDRARTTGDWRPRPGRLCSWCSHQDICPAYGGTPPPLPTDSATAAGVTAVAADQPAATAHSTSADQPAATIVPTGVATEPTAGPGYTALPAQALPDPAVPDPAECLAPADGA
jgi:putative RecB family exonuclease